MERELQGCLVTTNGGDDLRDKISYYLEQKEERARIAAAGYEYVVKHASVRARAEELLAFLKKL